MNSMIKLHDLTSKVSSSVFVGANELFAKFVGNHEPNMCVVWCGAVCMRSAACKLYNNRFYSIITYFEIIINGLHTVLGKLSKMMSN